MHFGVVRILKILGILSSTLLIVFIFIPKSQKKCWSKKIRGSTTMAPVATFQTFQNKKHPTICIWDWKYTQTLPLNFKHIFYVVSKQYNSNRENTTKNTNLNVKSTSLTRRSNHPLPFLKQCSLQTISWIQRVCLMSWHQLLHRLQYNT